jgi:hypothetical protein
MDLYRLLPTRQFSLLVFSLFLSAGLVYAADRVTHPTAHNTVEVDTTKNLAAYADTANWQAALESVQQSSGISLPDAPDQNTIQGLLQAAKNSNLTDTVSRSLFVNLVNVKGQGLGSDIPTQDQLVQSALSQIDATVPAKTYTAADIETVGNSAAELKAYGNATMAVFLTNSDQEFAKTLAIIDAVTTSDDATKLDLLQPIRKKYEKITKELAAIPAPKTLQPFHLELVNDYATITATYDAMHALITDPLGGLAAIQQYRKLTQDAGQMFINIAQSLDKNGILFNKDEPGATWGQLLQTQQ